VIAVAADQIGELVLECLGGCGGVAAGARGLGPDEHPHPVGVVEPARLLELEVLADESEAEIAGELEVADEGVVVRRGEAGLRPVALVEHSPDVEAATVQVELLSTGLDAPQPRGGHDPISGDAFADAELDRVQVRVARTPDARLVDIDATLEASVPVGQQGGLTPVDSGDDRDAGRCVPRHRARDGEPRQRVAAERSGLDVGPSARLQPHGLPDPRGRRERDSVVIVPRDGALLAVRDLALVGRRIHLDRQLRVPPGGDDVGDVELERGVAAGVRSEEHAVHEDAGFVMDGTEVQDDATALPLGGHGDRPSVDRALQPRAPHTGRAGLPGERDDDRRRFATRRLEVPLPVEGDPVLGSVEVWPRVLGLRDGHEGSAFRSFGSHAVSL